MSKLAEIIKENKKWNEFFEKEQDKVTLAKLEPINSKITYLLSLIEEKDKALEFYANDANWHYDQLGDGLIGDGGETARVALKSTKEE